MKVQIYFLVFRLVATYRSFSGGSWAPATYHNILVLKAIFNSNAAANMQNPVEKLVTFQRKSAVIENAQPQPMLKGDSGIIHCIVYMHLKLYVYWYFHWILLHGSYTFNRCRFRTAQKT